MPVFVLVAFRAKVAGFNNNYSESVNKQKNHRKEISFVLNQKFTSRRLAGKRERTSNLRSSCNCCVNRRAEATWLEACGYQSISFRFHLNEKICRFKIN